LKGIELIAIDKNFSGGTSGLEGEPVEKIGDFELIDPLGHHTGEQYIKHRTLTVVFGGFIGLVERLENFDLDGKGFKAEGFQGYFETGSIDHLVLVTHGSPGRVDINGLGRPVLETTDLADEPEVNGMEDFNPLSPKLFQRLGNFLSPDATVRLDGCNIGFGYKGTDLLIGLSRKWPGVKVTAFVDYAVGQPDRGDHRLWGIVDSNDLYPTHPTDLQMVFESNMNSMRSEDSSTAKTALNGAILKWPVSEILQGASMLDEVYEQLMRGPAMHPFGYGPY
jgi:hypothetical protein